MDLAQTSTAQDYFSASDKEAIRQAVARAEARSSGEIATMVVSESDRYREAEALGALLLSGFIGVAVAVLSHHVTIWTYIPVVFLLYFPVLLFLRRFPHLKLSFVGPRRLAEAVSERALVAFYQQGLYRTRMETGVLIFISLLERKVWIVGDRGINEKIPPGYWKSLAERLAQGLRTGRGAEAVCEVIEACGTELERHFPRGEDDRNELADEIIIS
ncbi:TPM domain-containing protein [Geomonas subterranea]|uniref:TPM domain-containing protein n=1 Tax=Geomonas subterranea TaxID=2847989 RepID=A0ABX8LML9_9BACT|nr:MULTISPECIES: TPM domain-containing protein [Geomonas]QXE92172.1 TPM domain-containing protein [Geomonas subterranea]QXM09730.1 TPM domain-containing protein [Geomonas subterranea]